MSAPGAGFWFLTMESLELAMPIGSHRALKVDSDACTQGPCYQQSIDQNSSWNLIGNPANSNVLYREMLVNNVDTLCTHPQTCNIADPVDTGIQALYFLYDTNRGSYRQLGTGVSQQKVVKPWDGYWVSLSYSDSLAELWNLFSYDYASQFVFITDERFSGNLGGVAAADDICRQAAGDAGLSGEYKAWLSDNSSSPNASFIKPDNPYLRVDGVLVADGYADLTDGALENDISTTATLQADIEDVVWSNTRADGTTFATNSARHCGNWDSTDAVSFIGTMVQDSTDVTGYWTLLSDKEFECSGEARLYCVGQ